MYVKIATSKLWENEDNSLALESLAYPAYYSNRSLCTLYGTNWRICFSRRDILSLVIVSFSLVEHYLIKES